MGRIATPAVSVPWRWYYHVPDFAIWILVALLLLALKENRTWQAWTILIPIGLLTTVAWPWLLRLLPTGFYAAVPSQEQLRFAMDWLVGAWVCVWLFGSRLARCRATIAFCLVLFFLVGSGLLAIASSFGAPGIIYALASMRWYGISATALLLGMTVGGLRCQRTFASRRFLVWLLLGTFVVVVLGTALNVGWMLAERWIVERLDSLSPWFLVTVGLDSLIQSLGLTGLLCLVNLPLIYLASKAPFYEARLHTALRLPVPVAKTAETSESEPGLPKTTNLP